MRRLLLTGVVAGLAAVAIATVGNAHDLFIKLDSYFLPPDTPVRVPVINGTFRLSENSITPDRVPDVSVVRDGRRRALGTDQWNAERDTTFLAIRTGGEGTYLLGLSTHPRELEMSGTEFNEYLAHDGVPDVLEQRERDGELDRGVTERYSKHVKAVFQVGDRRSGGIDLILGYPAELLPLTNPYELSVGDEMVVQAMVDGKPVPNQLVLAGGEGPSGVFEEMSARADAEGEARFTLHSAGTWYIKFINMQKVDAEGIDYESKWATLSFAIQ